MAEAARGLFTINNATVAKEIDFIYNVRQNGACMQDARFEHNHHFIIYIWNKRIAHRLCRKLRIGHVFAFLSVSTVVLVAHGLEDRLV